MIDFHSHILPGMDDGSRSAEESLAMLSSYSERITDVFLTPHFYPAEEHPKSFFKRRAAAVEKLKSAAENRRIRFRLGAEVAYFDGICTSEYIEDFHIEGTRLVLVEMPMCEWNGRMFDELIEMNRSLGLRPVLAHIDRYGFARGADRKYLETYLYNGGLVQVNAEAILSPISRITAVSMIRRGMIHFLGSDCHNNDSRKPNYDEAIDKLIKSKADDAVAIIGINENNFV